MRMLDLGWLSKELDDYNKKEISVKLGLTSGHWWIETNQVKTIHTG